MVPVDEVVGEYPGERPGATGDEVHPALLERRAVRCGGARLNRREPAYLPRPAAVPDGGLACVVEQLGQNRVRVGGAGDHPAAQERYLRSDGRGHRG